MMSEQEYKNSLKIAMEILEEQIEQMQKKLDTLHEYYFEGLKEARPK